MNIKRKEHILIKHKDTNTSLLRLERNNRDLLQLKSKLNSYVCEPNTYSLFEHMESLRHRIEHLLRNNSEIMLALQGKKYYLENYVDRVRNQLIEFKKLEKGIADYMTGLRS